MTNHLKLLCRKDQEGGLLHQKKKVAMKKSNYWNILFYLHNVLNYDKHFIWKLYTYFRNLSSSRRKSPTPISKKKEEVSVILIY